MARARVSTTVGSDLLHRRGQLRRWGTDSSLLEEALRALLARHRAAEIDAAYTAYEQQPLDTPDEWGDLAASVTRRVKRDRLPSRGDAWWCEPPHIGRRPVVVLSRDTALRRLRRAVVAPCTTIRDLPSEVLLEPGQSPVPRPCAVNLDSVESVSLGVLVERLGQLEACGCGSPAPPSASPSAATRNRAAPAIRGRRLRELLLAGLSGFSYPS